MTDSVVLGTWPGQPCCRIRPPNPLAATRRIWKIQISRAAGFRSLGLTGQASYLKDSEFGCPRGPLRWRWGCARWLPTIPSVPLEQVSPSGRPRNGDVRTREHLTPDEVEVLATAAKKRGRYGHRDALAIRMAARHGFRVSELCALRWDQIDLGAGLMHVHRDL